MTTSTVLPPHVGPTAEELAKRTRVRELRTKIAEHARYRTAMNRAFRLPHRSPEWSAAVDAAGALVPAYSRFGPHHTWAHRRYDRDTITWLHCELANLRGKKHLAD